MLRKLWMNKWREIFLTLVILTLICGTASAATFILRAGVMTKTMPDTLEVVTMWGFGQDAGPISVPGPILTVPPGDTTLTINLTNNLSVPVSLVIPGQIATMSPTWAGGRVVSFTTETLPGETRAYTWNNLKPGTYIYQSGTNPAVQVQMGLYGAVKKDAASGEAYSGKTYDSEVILLFSEIDPVIHTHVANGTYGTPPPGGITSTIDYLPRYFLINGESYSVGSQPPPILAGSVGQRLLIRFLNAGLQTHVPILQGTYLSLIAEDGNLYPYPKEQYSVILLAGKTIDTLFTPTAEGNYPVYDRRLNLTNKGVPQGGMLAYLAVATGTLPPVANDDAYIINEDNPLSVGAPGILSNDTGTGTLTATLVSNVGNGTLNLSSDGSFAYSPNPNFSGLDIFIYKACVGPICSSGATVRITVVPVNDPPVAVNDVYGVNEDSTLNVAAPGVLGNDSDVDGDTLSAILVNSVSNGTLTLNTDGSFTYTPNPNYSGMDFFTYKANDGSVDSNEATVTITVNPNVPPVAVNDFATTQMNTPVTINVVANDTDADGTIDPTTVTITTPPRRGTIVNNGNGTITYTPNLNFRGTDVFKYRVRDNNGALSNIATVRVNVVR